MINEQKIKSKCCNSPVSPQHGDTYWIQCTKCKRPCDPTALRVPAKWEDGQWEIMKAYWTTADYQDEYDGKVALGLPFHLFLWPAVKSLLQKERERCARILEVFARLPTKNLDQAKNQILNPPTS